MLVVVAFTLTKLCRLGRIAQVSEMIEKFKSNEQLASEEGYGPITRMSSLFINESSSDNERYRMRPFQLDMIGSNVCNKLNMLS